VVDVTDDAAMATVEAAVDAAAEKAASPVAAEGRSWSLGDLARIGWSLSSIIGGTRS